MNFRLMWKYFTVEIVLVKQHYWIIISNNIQYAGPYLWASKSEKSDKIKGLEYAMCIFMDHLKESSAAYT